MVTALPKPAETWTTRRLLEWMTGHFTAKSIDAPRVVSEMLLSHVIGCDRLRLYMEVDRPAQPLELASLREFVARAANHEPVQYLVGHAWFFGRMYSVTRSVLIPRPSTETLVQNIVQWCRAAPGHAGPLIADVGTGSGCIAISLAVQLAEAHVIATDISEDAIAVAADNARTHGVEDRIELRSGPELAPLAGEARQFDAICANPPYISDAEWAEVAANVRDHEPASALRGGPDGLDVIRPIIAAAPGMLRPEGRLAVEIAHAQRDAVL